MAHRSRRWCHHCFLYFLQGRLNVFLYRFQMKNTRNNEKYWLKEQLQLQLCSVKFILKSDLQDFLAEEENYEWDESFLS